MTDKLEPVISRAAKAVRALVESLKAYDDELLIRDSIEGETGFLEACETLLTAMAFDEALVRGLRDVIAEMEGRRERIMDRIAYRRTILEQALDIAGRKSVELSTATIGLSNRPPEVRVTNEDEIPARFWIKGKPRLDRRELKKALLALKEDPENGEPIPGAELSNAAPTLTIKRS